MTDLIGMVYQAGMVIFGVVLADYYLIRRQTRKVLNIVRAEFPLLNEVSDLLKSREFQGFVKRVLLDLDKVLSWIEHTDRCLKGLDKILAQLEPDEIIEWLADSFQTMAEMLNSLDQKLEVSELD